MIEPVLEILAEDDSLIVLNKPFGIPTSGRKLDDPDAVQFWLMKRFGCPIWAVHQLDADTTGINLFVKVRSAVAVWKRMLENDRTRKIYLALVHGIPDWEKVECREPIGMISERSLGVCEHGKAAYTRFTRIAVGCECSLVLAELFTGRTHQIRIHLAHLGFPLVGEEWYTDRPNREHFRQALHAWKIVGSDDCCSFEAPVPQDFLTLMNRFEIQGWDESHTGSDCF